jgi:Mn2+/Fe2+ NRAMP family transporter
MAEATPLPQRPSRGLLSGAAFLMAVSAIGPGFLTQTTLFTAQLGASLAFAILLSVIIDIGAQLNTWRVICVSRRRGHEVADAVVPGYGWILTAVIVVGSFVFNLGNLAGCALALSHLFGLHASAGAALSAAVAVGLFLLPRALVGVDWFSKILGAGMILMTLYIVVVTAPPLERAALEAVSPEEVQVSVIITFIGGTIGGYIMFSGAHRLLDGGVGGPAQVAAITWASVQGILIAGVMRAVLFLAVLGVVTGGAQLGAATPVFDAFRHGAGDLGFYLSTLVFWSAAITSVVGCSYTSISFLQRGEQSRTSPRLTVAFTLLSLAATLLLQAAGWKETPLLVAAGKINGILLPVLLGVILVAAYRPGLMGGYRHPWWAGAFGLIAWTITVFMAVWTALEMVGLIEVR